MNSLVPVILCGGAGTRLWPLSTVQQPKQFHALLGPRSLFQDTVERAMRLHSVSPPLVICGTRGESAVNEQLAEIDCRAAAVIVEPEGRNTAPAIAAAAQLAMQRAESGSTPILAVLSADHAFLDTPSFLEAVGVAAEAAATGQLVVFGVRPDRPETGYGYIREGEDRGRWAQVAEFVEKPDLATARDYLESGRYAWNSGMFVFSAKQYLDELTVLEPSLVEAVSESMASAKSSGHTIHLGNRFLDAPSVSIDNAVMERTDNAVVVSLDAGWSDIGSWPAVHQLSDKDVRDNATRGDVVLSNADGNLVFATSRRVSVVGAKNLAIVETADEVLVLSLDHAQSLKEHVERLDQSGREKE